MRLAHPLRCAEVEIHQVTKRDERLRTDTRDGVANQKTPDHVSKTSSGTTSDVHKQSLLKDFNETLYSPGNCFPSNRSRASSANSSLSGGEDGHMGTDEDIIEGSLKSRIIPKSKKRMKPRSKSKSKFYAPSPSSSIDGIDVSDLGSPGSNMGSVGSPEGNMVVPLCSPDRSMVHSVNDASTPVSGNMVHLGLPEGNVVPVGSSDSSMVYSWNKDGMPLRSPQGIWTQNQKDNQGQSLILDGVTYRINIDSINSGEGTSKEKTGGEDHEGLVFDTTSQPDTYGNIEEARINSPESTQRYAGEESGSKIGDISANNAESELRSVINQQPTSDASHGISSVSTSQLSDGQLSGDQLVNSQLSGGKLSRDQLSGDQLTNNQLSGGQSSNNQLSGAQLSDEGRLTYPINTSGTGEVVRSPSTDSYSDVILGSHADSSLGNPGNLGLTGVGVPVGPDSGTGTLTSNNSVTEIATRQGGGPVPLSRIKCLVSMTTPRDMYLCGTTSLPGFVEFNMSLDGFGCLFFPSIAPHVPAGRTELNY